MKDLEISSTLKDTIPVLTSPQVSIRFNIKQLFDYQDTVIIDQIAVNNVLIRLKVDHHGNKNFQLFHPYDSTKRVPKLIKIKECLFQNTSLNYQFASKQRNYWFNLNTTKLKFDIYKHDIDFNIEAIGKIDSLTEHTTSFLHSQTLKGDIKFNFRKRDKNLIFKKAHIWISDVLFEVFGDFLVGKERDYHLDFRVNTIQLGKLFSFLPKNIHKQLSFFESSSNFKIRGKIVGKDDLKINPYTELIVECDSAKLLDSKQKTILYDFSFGMRYNNGIARNAASSTLLVDINTHFESKYPFNFALRITKFEQMQADLTINGTVPLKPIAGLLVKNSNINASGLLNINFSGKAPLKYISKLDSLHLLKANGNLELRNIELFGLLNPNIDLFLSYGKFNIFHNKLTCNQLDLELNHQKFKFAGMCENFLPYLTNSNTHITSQFTLNTNILFVDSLLKLRNISIKRRNNIYHNNFYIPKRILLQGKIIANQLFYKKYHLYKINLLVNIDTTQAASIDLTVSQKNDVVYLNSKLSQNKNYIDVFTDLKLIIPNINQSYCAWTGKKQTNLNIFSYDQEFLISGRFSNQFKQNLPDSFWVLIQGKNGSIKHPNPKFSLKNIRFETEIFDDLINNNLEISLKNIYTIIDNHLLNATVKIKNLSNPIISLNLYANLSLSAIMAHLPKLPVESVSGKINFGVFASFPLRYINHIDSLFYLNSMGFVDIDSLNFTLISSKLRLSNIHTRIEFDNNSTQIKQIYGKIGTCAFVGHADTKELLPYIFLKNKNLVARVNFQGDTLNLKELLIRDNQRPEKGLLFDFPDLLNLIGDFSFQSIYYERFKLNNPATKLRVNDRMLNVDTIYAGSCEGEIGGKIHINAFPKKMAFVKSIVNVKNINLQKLFYSLNNFNQEFITDKNIDGKLYATINYQDSVPYTFQTDFMHQKAMVSANIQNGKLDSFYLFNKLSPFINKEALEHTRFTMSADSVLISNRTINVPNFQIYSNIINLVISGYQTFDLEMNYFLWFERIKRRKESNTKTQITPQFLKTILVFKITGLYPNIHFKYDASLAWKRIWGRKPVRKFKSENDFFNDF